MDSTTIVICRPVHYNRHFTEITSRCACRTDGVHRVVTRGAVSGSLRTNKNNWHRRVKHETQGCGTVCHRISAVRDDDPLNPALDLIVYRTGEFLPDYRRHILREDCAHLFCAISCDLSECRDCYQDVIRIELARHRAGTVIDPARNGATCRDDGKFGKCRVLADR